MPFITQARREELKEAYDDSVLPLQPGDRCYMYYKEMVREWKSNPRWTTAHEIYKDLFRMPLGDITDDEICAKSLAWQVFFNIYVMEYESRKRLENGDI